MGAVQPPRKRSLSPMSAAAGPGRDRREPHVVRLWRYRRESGSYSAPPSLRVWDIFRYRTDNFKDAHKEPKLPVSVR